MFLSHVNCRIPNVALGGTKFSFKNGLNSILALFLLFNEKISKSIVWIHELLFIYWLKNCFQSVFNIVFHGSFKCNNSCVLSDMNMKF